MPEPYVVRDRQNACLCMTQPGRRDLAIGGKPTHPNLETVSVFILTAVLANRVGKDRGVKPSIANSTRQTQEDTDALSLLARGRDNGGGDSEWPENANSSSSSDPQRPPRAQRCLSDVTESDIVIVKGQRYSWIVLLVLGVMFCFWGCCFFSSRVHLGVMIVSKNVNNESQVDAVSLCSCFVCFLVLAPLPSHCCCCCCSCCSCCCRCGYQCPCCHHRRQHCRRCCRRCCRRPLF